MKKMLMLCSCAIVLVFGAGSALAQPNYQFAEAGTKNFISETTIAPGDPISLDLWLTAADAPQNSGGAWIDFTGSTAEISYVSGGRCFIDGSEGCTGPWTSGVGALANEPSGPGTFFVQVVNLGGAAPDVDGDLIVGTLTLECSALGDATIDLTVIPTVPTWAPIADVDVVLGSVLIHQLQTCLIDADCDNGEFCNGDETCVGGECQAGTDPCAPQLCDEGTETCADCFIDADCDDGEFCNGEETCVDGVCQAGSDPCPDDGQFCTGTEICDEAGDQCEHSGNPCLDDGLYCNGTEICDENSDACVSSDDPCLDDGAFCNGVEGCDEEADQCVSSGYPCAEDEICIEEGNACEPGIIEATFEGCGSAFLPEFGIVTIQGTGTDFGLLSIVRYNSLMVVKVVPRLLNQQNQKMTHLVAQFPSLDPFFPVLLPAYPITVVVTVDGLSDTFEIPACPGLNPQQSIHEGNIEMQHKQSPMVYNKPSGSFFAFSQQHGYVPAGTWQPMEGTVPANHPWIKNIPFEQLGAAIFF